LGWRIERVLGTSYTLREAGSDYIQLFEPIDAEVDFDNKIITVGVDERVPDREINFSLANEIGHIIVTHLKLRLTDLLRNFSCQLRL
jgi:hypothetical protein